jgi:hypothetical protein
LKVKPNGFVPHCCEGLFGPRPAFLALLLVMFGLLAPGRALAVGTWTPVARVAPDINIGAMMLLPDGTVMCQKWTSCAWDRLTPDTNGSYINGTWSIPARMINDRDGFQSQILCDGRLFVAGGAAGSGHGRAEIYQITNNLWTATPDPAPVLGQSDDTFSFIDSPSELLPNGDVLEDYGNLIYEVASNEWVQCPGPLGDQDEASWIKLPDDSILSIDYQPPDSTSTSSERFIPSLNEWIADAPVSQQEFDLDDGEIGEGFLLPNGQVFQLGGTGTTAIYTPSGTTNTGVWVDGPDIPDQLYAEYAPAAMLANGKILCVLASTPNPEFDTVFYYYYYEFDPVSNTFTQAGSPFGGTHSDLSPAYNEHLLDLPDGSVLFCDANTLNLYVYQPDGSPVTNGQPVINTVTTNLDGSYHLTGTLFNGISEGASYGNEFQSGTDFPVARLTNSTGLVRYARTYNWSSTSIFTGTNIMTTEMALPAGLLPGTYQLSVSANGISSAAVPLTVNGTPLPAVANLAFASIASNQMILVWNPINLTEAGYLVQRSTDGIQFTNVASLGAGVTNYTDNSVTPLGQFYYRVLGTNAVGLGIFAEDFAASPPVVAVPGPWRTQDVGAVPGAGASGHAAGTYTVIGSGSIGGSGDQFQSVFLPIIGDLTITARVTVGQDTGSNAMAGVMIRNSIASGSIDAFMGFGSGTSNSIFEARTVVGGAAASAAGPGSLNTPFWVRLGRTGGVVTGYTSPDGNIWTALGSMPVAMEPVVYAGLAVASSANALLSTATFDSVTVTGTQAASFPPLAEWKLDETSGTTAVDSRSGLNGIYNNCFPGQPGATANTGTSVGLNGSSYIVIPPLNLNSNTVTITAWVKSNGEQIPFAAIFYFSDVFSESGIYFGYGNDLRYVWNNNPSAYFFDPGLVVPNNEWTFVALVIQPTEADLYMVTNGVLSAATNFTSHTVAAFDSSSYLGADPGYGYFVGQLDEVSVYADQALTSEQISQLGSMSMNPSKLATMSVNLSPASFTGMVNGTNLNLSWPTDHIGWRLLTQTNHLATGVSASTNDWAAVPGSSASNYISVPIDPKKPAGYYRLAYP